MPTLACVIASMLPNMDNIIQYINPTDRRQTSKQRADSQGGLGSVPTVDLLAFQMDLDWEEDPRLGEETDSGSRDVEDEQDVTGREDNVSGK
jgi:hypothetical protein